MRRLFAFGILLITILAVTFFNLTNAFEDVDIFNIGYRGDSAEITYRLVDDNGEAIDDQAKVDHAVNLIENRLVSAGISNPTISKSLDNRLVVRFPIESTAVVDRISRYVGTDPEISFRRIEGASADELLGVASSFVDAGGVQIIRASDETSALQIQFTVSNKSEYANVKTNAGNETVAIWINFNSYGDDSTCLDINDPEQYCRDSYDRFNEISQGQITDDTRIADIRYKHIANGTLVDLAEDQTVINISCLDVVNEYGVDYYNNLLSAGELDGYHLQYVDKYIIRAPFGLNPFSITAIAFAIATVIVIAMLVVFYRLPGLISSLSIILVTTFDIMFFNLIGGRFSLEAVIAIIVGVILAIDSNILLFNRFKQELYKGRMPHRAYKEASRKTLFTVLDTSLILLVASIALYFITSGSLKSFTLMLFIGSLFSFVLITFISRILLSIVATASVFEKNTAIFGVDKSQIADIERDEKQKYFGKFTNFNLSKFFKKITLPLLIVAAVGSVTVGALNLGGVSFSKVSYLDTTTRITLYSSSVELDTSSEISNFFNTELETNPKEIVYYKNQSKGRIEFLVYLENNLSEQFKANFNTAIENYNLAFITADPDADAPLLVKQYLENFESRSEITYLVNTTIAILIALGVIILYFIIRLYRFTNILTFVGTILVSLALEIVAIYIFRIPLDVPTFSVLLISLFLTSFFAIISLEKFRELKVENKNMLVNEKTLTDLVVKAQQSIVSRYLVAFFTLLIFVVVIILLTVPFFFAFNIALILGAIFAVLSSVFVLPYLWIFLESKFIKTVKKNNFTTIKPVDKKKKEKKKKDVNTPEEVIFFGIND